jgi:hypothetical protein
MSNDIPIQNVAVIADPSTLSMSSHGSITGVIAIRTENTFFPEARWRDFPVVILGWWLAPVSRIVAGTSRVWECRFMDGPLSLHLEQQNSDAWTLQGRHSGHTEVTATISCRAFIHSLLEAAQHLAQECRQRGWTNRDIETLESEIRRIKSDVP